MRRQLKSRIEVAMGHVNTPGLGGSVAYGGEMAKALQGTIDHRNPALDRFAQQGWCSPPNPREWTRMSDEFHAGNNLVDIQP